MTVPRLVMATAVAVGAAVGAVAALGLSYFSPASAAPGDIQVPAIVTSASGPVTVGAPIMDSADVVGGNQPTGTIEFRLFGAADPSCAGPPLFSSTVAVLGPGRYHSGRFAPSRPGIYQWATRYSGDAHNLPFESGCPTGGEASTVLIGVPSLITGAPPTVALGEPLTDTVLISGGAHPAGTLVFAVFGPNDPTCAATPAFTFPPVTVAGAGIYRSGPFTPATSGTYRFAVRYSGDANNLALSTRCESSSQQTAIAPAISPRPFTPASVGQPFVASEVLSGGLNPTGTITFRVYGPNDPTCTGRPAFTSPPVTVQGNGTYTAARFTPTAPGFYTVVAAYSGDANNAATRTECAANQTLSVSRAIPTMVVKTVRQAFVGMATTADETLTDGLHPTGSVRISFYSPADPTCTGRPLLASPPQPVTGNGIYHSAPLRATAPGTYRFVAVYSGDANNIPLTTDCNAANQAVLVRVFGLYDPADHPRSVIELEVVGFALLAATGSAGGGRNSGPGQGSGPSPGSGDGPGSSASQAASPSQGAVVATGLDNTAEGWEAMALVAAGEAGRLENMGRGDQSRTWLWPGTRRIDTVSTTLPVRVAPASPLIARITNDAGYLRAMFGSASALLPSLGMALAVVAVLEVHGHAVPPPFFIAMALAVLGVVDALSGLLAVATFVAGVIALGGLSTSNDARTLLGLSSLWFAAPIIAGVARPLRRPPTRSTAEHVERAADVVVAALMGAWAVKSMVEGLPGLAGMDLPIAANSNLAALIVLAALGLRMIIETVAAHHYPIRLSEVQPGSLPPSGRAQHITSAILGLVVFLFVALPYVGRSWELYLGSAFFAVPILLRVYRDRLPNFPRLYAVLPRGVLLSVLMLVIGTVFGAFVAQQLQNKTNQQVIRESFVLLSLPGLGVSLLQIIGRDGPKPPKIHWLPEKIFGAVVVVVGILIVLGFITI